ncbi:hypothetical protein LNKW23_41830 [Paralimibaculum aggregatum]|uniref:Uncharacterized protein n=1 Tax=Paralimibaculum aggregatum TaxID=3036245 RepID=A0ABQ6LRD5_9RHOB|nr:hypothetical protein LNKW23_41830 [Limibaculum sp. NKW23]
MAIPTSFYDVAEHIVPKRGRLTISVQTAAQKPSLARNMAGLSIPSDLRRPVLAMDDTVAYPLLLRDNPRVRISFDEGWTCCPMQHAVGLPCLQNGNGSVRPMLNHHIDIIFLRVGGTQDILTIGILLNIPQYK